MFGNVLISHLRYADDLRLFVNSFLKLCSRCCNKYDANKYIPVCKEIEYLHYTVDDLSDSAASCMHVSLALLRALCTMLYTAANLWRFHSENNIQTVEPLVLEFVCGYCK